MEIETEQLLQKWLKMQIWKNRISFIFWTLIILSFILGIWYSINYVLPPLQKQIENTQKIMEQISKTSELTEENKNFLKDFFEKTGENQEF